MEKLTKKYLINIIIIKMATKDLYIVKNSNDVLKWGTVIVLLIVFIYLIGLSIINQDLKYPREHPLLFTLETLLFSLGSAVVVFLMAYGRDDLTLMTVVQYFAVAAKFGLLHILFQFSGFYSYAFAYKT